MEGKYTSCFSKYGGLLVEEVGGKTLEASFRGKVCLDDEEGCLETLVQFYDPLYHCFTFPDY